MVTIGVLSFSFVGAGVLLATDDNDYDRIKTTVALCPTYINSSNIDVQILLVTDTDDLLMSPIYV